MRGCHPGASGFFGFCAQLYTTVASAQNSNNPNLQSQAEAIIPYKYMLEVTLNLKPCVFIVTLLRI